MRSKLCAALLIALTSIALVKPAHTSRVAERVSKTVRETVGAATANAVDANVGDTQVAARYGNRAYRAGRAAVRYAAPPYYRVAPRYNNYGYGYRPYGYGGYRGYGYGGGYYRNYGGYGYPGYYGGYPGVYGGSGVYFYPGGAAIRF